jgi:hypothetical protein
MPVCRVSPPSPRPAQFAGLAYPDQSQMPQVSISSHAKTPGGLLVSVCGSQNHFGHSRTECQRRGCSGACRRPAGPNRDPYLGHTPSRCGRDDDNVALLTRPPWLFPAARQIGSEKEELIGGNYSAFETVRGESGRFCLAVGGARHGTKRRRRMQTDAKGVPGDDGPTPASAEPIWATSGGIMNHAASGQGL